MRERAELPLRGKLITPDARKISTMPSASSP